MKKSFALCFSIVLMSAFLFSGCTFSNTKTAHVQLSATESLITPAATQTQEYPSVMPSAETTTVVPTATPAPTTEPTAAPTSEPTATPTMKPTAAPSPAPVYVTEKRYGFVTNAYFYAGVNFIEIDYVDLYYGDEKLKMAIKDHAPGLEKDENGNYYYPYDGPYIRNISKKLRIFAVDPKCKIQLVNENDPSLDFLKVSFKEFYSAEKKVDWGLLMYVNVKKGVIVSMEELYLE